MSYSISKQQFIDDANAIIKMWKVTGDFTTLRRGVIGLAEEFRSNVWKVDMSVVRDKNEKDCIGKLYSVFYDSDDCTKHYVLNRKNIFYGDIENFFRENLFTDDDFDIIDYTDDNCDEYYFVNPDKK